MMGGDGLIEEFQVEERFMIDTTRELLGHLSLKGLRYHHISIEQSYVRRRTSMECSKNLSSDDG